MSLSDLTVWLVRGFRCVAAKALSHQSPAERSTEKRRVKYSVSRRFITRCALASGLLIVVDFLDPVRAQAEEPKDESSQAEAQQRAAESERFAARGFEAYKAGQYETALQFYNQALDLHPVAALYFNVARIYETKLSEAEKALVYYRKTLEASDVTEALVEKSLARIRALTALIEQENQPEEKTPPSEQSASKVSEPPPDERAAQPGAPDEPVRSRRSAQKTIGYAVGITGLVAAGAGLGLGGFALLERDKARETCDGNQCTSKGGVDAMNTAYDLATASTITMAAGGALAAVGFAMVLFAPRSESAAHDSAAGPEPAGPTPVQFAIVPTVGGAGLNVAGAFF